MSILIRFWLGAVALTEDVKQMFRQILLESSQCDYQRIVWRFSNSEPIAAYKLKTVTFGIIPSPYLAIRCLLQLAKEGKENQSLASIALQSSLYVDDIVTSVRTVEETRALQLQILLQSAGFALRKWASSHPDVERSRFWILQWLDAIIRLEREHFLKVLGLRWYARPDCFEFQVHPLQRDCSKRMVLSELARIRPIGISGCIHLCREASHPAVVDSRFGLWLGRSTSAWFVVSGIDINFVTMHPDAPSGHTPAFHRGI